MNRNVSDARLFACGCKVKVHVKKDFNTIAYDILLEEKGYKKEQKVSATHAPQDLIINSDPGAWIKVT